VMLPIMFPMHSLMLPVAFSLRILSRLQGEL